MTEGKARISKGRVGTQRPVAKNAQKHKSLRERELEKRLGETLKHQTAIGEILRVISSSPGNVKPILNVVVELAMKLCDAVDSTV